MHALKFQQAFDKTNFRRWLFLKAFLRSISSHISWLWRDCFDRPVRGFLLVGHVVQWEMTTQRGWLQGTRPYWVLWKEWRAPGAHVWAATSCRSCPVTVAPLNYSRPLYDKSNYQLLPLAAVVSTNTNACILTLFDILKMHLESSCHIYAQTVIYQVNQVDSSELYVAILRFTGIGRKTEPIWLTSKIYWQIFNEQMVHRICYKWIKCLWKKGSFGCQNCSNILATNV